MLCQLQDQTSLQHRLWIQGAKMIFRMDYALEAIRLYLEQTILQKAIQSDTTILDLKVPRSPLPSPQDRTIPDERLRTLISATVDASRTFVRGGCAKCHLVEDKELPFETSLLATDHPQKNSSSQSTWFSVGPVRFLPSGCERQSSTTKCTGRPTVGNVMTPRIPIK